MTSFNKWWCRLVHSRGKKAFALPTPHPKGQKFMVKCQQCGNVYAVITPAGWTSPWRSKAEIEHADREDPVQEHNGQWWFWNGITHMQEGPFSTEAEAREAYKRFCVELSQTTTKAQRRGANGSSAWR